MEINLSDVHAEVTTAFARYEEIRRERTATVVRKSHANRASAFSPALANDNAVATEVAREWQQERVRERMGRNAEPHGVEPACDGVGDMRLTSQDDRERTGPKCGRQLASIVGYLARPIVDLTSFGKVDDERMIRRPPLRTKDLRDGCGIRCVGAESVDRLGRKRDQLPRVQ